MLGEVDDGRVLLEAPAGLDYAWEAIKSDFGGGMHRHLDDLLAGATTGEQAFRRMAAEAQRAHHEAYLIGKSRWTRRPRLNADDLAYLARANAAEMKFLKGFVGDVTSGAVPGPGRMPPHARMDLYVESLNGFRNNAELEHSPENVEVHWILGIADHCEDCLALEGMNPWTKASLPCVPGDGSTRCLCLLSDQVSLTTSRGQIKMRDIEVGDKVLTHRGRWRRVLAKHVNRSTAEHRYAVMVTERGLVGLTSDHLLWTSFGWKTAEEVSRADLRVLRGLREAEAEAELSAEVPSSLCGRCEERGGAVDPGVRLLRQDLQSGKVPDRAVEVGQVLLLEGVLPEGHPLYDLAVEEDASFCVDGLIAHNSNCKCHLEYVSKPRKVARELAKQRLGRPSVLQDVMSLPRPPRGFTLPTAAERTAIESVRHEVNHWRRMMAAAHEADDDELFRRYAALRKAANAKLIKISTDRKVWDPPALSVDEVVTGQVLDDRLVDALMAAGLDGGTVARMPSKQYHKLIRDVLKVSPRLSAEVRAVIRKGPKK